jgi:hypothetical protein
MPARPRLEYGRVAHPHTRPMWTRLDRVTAQELWGAIMWCCTRQQLRDVGRKIRQEWAATPETARGERGRARPVAYHVANPA